MTAQPPAVTASSRSESSTACTVFVRFVPPTSNLRRHHLEALFSEIGPIKKSSVIHKQHKTSVDKVTGATSSTPTASSYAFVRYTARQDAVTAASKLHNGTLKISNSEKVQIKVELATTAATTGTTATTTTSKGKGAAAAAKPAATAKDDGNATSNNALASVHIVDQEQEPASKKLSSRLILRNLSFYAKESHIRKVLQEKFGPLAEVHIPTVGSSATKKGSNNTKGVPTTHRGFCFVTFDKEADAVKCLEFKQEIVIAKRAVKVAHSLNKTSYERGRDDFKKNAQEQADKESDHDDEDDDDDDDDSSSDGDGSSSSDDDSESGSDSDSDSDSDDDDADEEKKAVKTLEKGEKKARHRDRKQGPDINKEDEALSHQRTLFVRNLPFDATRHDLFQIFVKFGYVSSIYLVKDKVTGIPKGTAFVAYQKEDAAQKALAAASSQDSFVSQRQEGDAAGTGAPAPGEGLTCKGRRLFVDLAVDKETASTLTVEKGKDANKLVGKDRRHLYLQNEGRVDNNADASEGSQTAWDDLPEGDQAKRQQAWSDKNTKLRSPIFSINPTRLSIRNLSKNVDEADFKRVCVDATLHALKTDMISAEDQIAHWKAKGEMTTRDILAKIQELGGDKDKKAIIPEFEEKNIRQFIPSVFIDRDYSTSKKKNEAPSRGFGFIDFQHHMHALACLRELNNNPRYSEVYVTGGKHAMEAKRRAGKRRKRGADAKPGDFIGEDGRAKVPRLVVEFAVENVVKAKQQYEHRAQQQANFVKQKVEKTEPTGKEKRKKHRGAIQRERKRKAREDGTTDTKGAKTDKKKEPESSRAVSTEKPEKKPKLAKPPQKRKVDKEDEKFSKLVETYKQAFSGKPATKDQAAATQVEKKSTDDKRWFE